MPNKSHDRRLGVLTSSVAAVVVLAISGLASSPPANANPGGVMAKETIMA